MRFLEIVENYYQRGDNANMAEQHRWFFLVTLFNRSRVDFAKHIRINHCWTLVISEEYRWDLFWIGPISQINSKGITYTCKLITHKVQLAAHPPFPWCQTLTFLSSPAVTKRSPCPFHATNRTVAVCLSGPNVTTSPALIVVVSSAKSSILHCQLFRKIRTFYRKWWLLFHVPVQGVFLQARNSVDERGERYEVALLLHRPPSFFSVAGLPRRAK